MIVCYMLDYVMFDISIVTCMVGWIEIEIFLLVILNNFNKAIFNVFHYCIGLDCVQKLLFLFLYVDNYFMTVTI